MAPAARISVLIIAGCLALTVPAMAAPAAAKAAPRALDQARIHAQYHDGDFDKVIKELEGFLKSGKSCSPAESLFVEKHLAVVYAANPGTRELGRYHMFRMLDLAPGSDLLDMFVGEEVDAVFDKVRKEYSLRAPVQKVQTVQKKVAAPVVAYKPAPAKQPPPPHAPAQPKAAWESASFKAPVPAAKEAWDSFASKPAAAAAAKGVSTTMSNPSRSSAASVPDFGPGSGPNPGSNPNSGFASDAQPGWKEPGLWIGGGAALAVVALTLLHSKTPDAPEAKTYVVPATAAR